MSKARPKTATLDMCSGYQHPASAGALGREGQALGRWVYDEEDFLPKVCTTLRDDDTLASIMWGSDGGQIVKVAWARLEPDDKVSVGTIEVSAGNELEAANNLNERLGSSVVNRGIKLGTNAIEKFYYLAGVMPTWRCLVGGDNSLVKIFTVRVANGVGFAPYRPLHHRGPPEVRVKLEIEALMALRWASQICRIELFARRSEYPLVEN